MEYIELIGRVFSSWPRVAALVAFVAGIVIQSIWRRFSVQGISTWIQTHNLIGRAVDNLAFPLLGALIILVCGTGFNRVKAYLGSGSSEQQQANSNPGQDGPSGKGADPVIDETHQGELAGGAKTGDAKPTEESIVVRGQDALAPPGKINLCANHSRMPIGDFINVSGPFYRCEHCQGILKFTSGEDGVEVDFARADELAPIPPSSPGPQVKRNVVRQR